MSIETVKKGSTRMKMKQHVIIVMTRMLKEKFRQINNVTVSQKLKCDGEKKGLIRIKL
jgi:hypothetical protein